MEKAPPTRAGQIKVLIEEFIAERLAVKVEKLKDDDPKRDEFVAKYQPSVWLEDAARRAGQIQAVTHTLKAIHPDARGSSWHVPPSSMAALQVVGSHCLGQHYDLDVVGNAAALDVYTFLRLEHQQQTLLQLAQQDDVDFAAALSGNPAQAAQWMQAFAGLLETNGKPAAHTLAKQLYWPIDCSQVHDDQAFHLLEPLYASSLAHRVYEQLQADRFGDEAKAAREAKKANALHDQPVRVYLQLAIQKMGGSNKQNIGQLNVQRGGKNFLFASVPPSTEWRNGPKPLLKLQSAFTLFGTIARVRFTVKALAKFLNTEPDPVKATRETRDEYLETLIDEWLAFTAEMRSLDVGWSQHPDCQLAAHLRYWLDPQGAKMADPADSPLPESLVLAKVSDDFASWFNDQLHSSPIGALPVGDPEYHYWRKQVREALKAFERDGGVDARSEQELAHV